MDREDPIGRQLPSDSPDDSGTEHADAGVGVGSSSAYRHWTAQEDARLRQLVEEYGATRQWNKIAKLLSDAEGTQRTSKSCRLRWVNQLRDDLKKGAFTPEEDQAIIQGHAELGNKWSLIAKSIPGRTDNAIKNRWNTALRKRVQQQEELQERLRAAAHIAAMADQHEAAAMLTQLAETVPDKPEQMEVMKNLLDAMSGEESGMSGEEIADVLASLTSGGGPERHATGTPPLSAGQLLPSSSGAGQPAPSSSGVAASSGPAAGGSAAPAAPAPPMGAFAALVAALGGSSAAELTASSGNQLAMAANLPAASSSNQLLGHAAAAAPSADALAVQLQAALGQAGTAGLFSMAAAGPSANRAQASTNIQADTPPSLLSMLLPLMGQSAAPAVPQQWALPGGLSLRPSAPAALAAPQPVLVAPQEVLLQEGFQGLSTERAVQLLALARGSASVSVPAPPASRAALPPLPPHGAGMLTAGHAQGGPRAGGGPSVPRRASRLSGVDSGQAEMAEAEAATMQTSPPRDPVLGTLLAAAARALTAPEDRQTSSTPPPVPGAHPGGTAGTSSRRIERGGTQPPDRPGSVPVLHAAACDMPVGDVVRQRRGGATDSDDGEQAAGRGPHRRSRSLLGVAGAAHQPSAATGAAADVIDLTDAEEEVVVKVEEGAEGGGAPAQLLGQGRQRPSRRRSELSSKKGAPTAAGARQGSGSDGDQSPPATSKRSRMTASQAGAQLPAGAAPLAMSVPAGAMVTSQQQQQGASGGPGSLQEHPLSSAEAAIALLTRAASATPPAHDQPLGLQAAAAAAAAEVIQQQQQLLQALRQQHRWQLLQSFWSRPGSLLAALQPPPAVAEPPPAAPDSNALLVQLASVGLQTLLAAQRPPLLHQQPPSASGPAPAPAPMQPAPPASSSQQQPAGLGHQQLTQQQGALREQLLRAQQPTATPPDQALKHQMLQAYLAKTAEQQQMLLQAQQQQQQQVDAQLRAAGPAGGPSQPASGASSNPATSAAQLALTSSSQPSSVPPSFASLLHTLHPDTGTSPAMLAAAAGSSQPQSPHHPAGAGGLAPAAGSMEGLVSFHAGSRDLLGSSPRAFTGALRRPPSDTHLPSFSWETDMHDNFLITPMGSFSGLSELGGLQQLEGSQLGGLMLPHNQSASASWASLLPPTPRRAAAAAAAAGSEQQLPRSGQPSDSFLASLLAGSPVMLPASASQLPPLPPVSTGQLPSLSPASTSQLPPLPPASTSQLPPLPPAAAATAAAVPADLVSRRHSGTPAPALPTLSTLPFLGYDASGVPVYGTGMGPGLAAAGGAVTEPPGPMHMSPGHSPPRDE